MINSSDFLETYISLAPLPLAIERYWECEIQAEQAFQRPVFDLGCGEGIFANVLFDERIDLGIDPNAKELKRAAQYDKYEELLACFGDNVPKNDATYATIFSNSVLEHIPEIEKTVAEIRRLLAENGTVYLTLPTDKFEQYTVTYQLLERLNLTQLQKRYVKRFNRFWRHYHCYNHAGWESLFNQHGLKIKTSFEYGTKAQCTFNSFASPFCGFALVVKKLTNHWFLFPPLRKALTKIFYLPLFRKFAKLQKLQSGEGGLIFFALEKA